MQKRGGIRHLPCWRKRSNRNGVWPFAHVFVDHAMPTRRVSLADQHHTTYNDNSVLQTSSVWWFLTHVPLLKDSGECGLIYTTSTRTPRSAGWKGPSSTFSVSRSCTRQSSNTISGSRLNRIYYQAVATEEFFWLRPTQDKSLVGVLVQLSPASVQR